jgi:uncharacterized membrane protein YoaT (DUF817 family)
MDYISCFFPVFIFSALAITKVISIPLIPRYDLLLIACLAMQYSMYKVKIESKEDIAVICLFHLLGIMMELFKVNHNSWSYPEHAYTKFFGVPLYSGFMYASVASYICQAWKNFSLKLTKWPSLKISYFLAFVIYGNFFSNAYLPDLRLIIIPLIFITFRSTWVYFETNGVTRCMPMTLSFLLIAFFIWIAENVTTFLGAWQYPHQSTGWSLVKVYLLSSWFLLVIVSIIIVAILKQTFYNVTFCEENKTHIY